jgi:hypothetical protein
MKNISTWWGETRIPLANTMQLDIGLLSLAIENKGLEWHIYSKYEKDAEDLNDRVNKVIGPIENIDYKNTTRLFVNNQSELIQIDPVLADRPVVCRPLKPIMVLPNSKVTLYVSTPIWLSLKLVGKNTELLHEIATQRLSDTWFGPSTMKGDLCYASSTNGRTDINALPVSSNRVVTPLVIHNATEKSLSFERVSIPVPMLSIFITKNGQFHTESVGLTWQDENNFAKLKIGEKQVNTKLLSEPRQKAEQGQFIRAFSAIFK